MIDYRFATLSADDLSALRGLINEEIESFLVDNYLYVTMAYSVDRSDKNKKAHNVILTFKKEIK